MMSRIKACSATLALLLAACGGGGGGDDAPPPPAGATPITLTSANSKAVAADAVENATNTEAADAGASLVTGVQVEAGGSAGSGTGGLAAAALVLAGKASALPALATAVAVDRTENCTGGGTLSMTGSVSGGSSLVAGDTLTMSASNCRESVGGVLQTLNGSMTISIMSGSFTNANLFPYSITMAIVARNFGIASGGVTTTTDGDLLMVLSATSGTAQSTTLSGTRLANSTTTSGGTRSATLKNYRQELTVGSTTVSSNVSGTVETVNSRLGSGTHSYVVSTPTPLVINIATDAYVSGSMKIVGNNSALLVTVTGSNAFSVQVDGNGDGTYESSSTATRAELDALL